MPRNGSGLYALPAGNPVVAGDIITDTWANATLSDLAEALTASLASDGQKLPTANLRMGGYKITGASDGSGDTDYATVGQIPKLARPIVSVRQANPQAIVSTVVGQTTKLTGFTLVESNYGGWWSTSNSKLTPTIAGWYQIGVSVQFEQPANPVRVMLALYKNDTLFHQSNTIRWSSGTDNQLVEITIAVLMNGTTDYLDARVWAAGAVSTFYVNQIPIAVYNSFQALLIGA